MKLSKATSRIYTLLIVLFIIVMGVILFIVQSNTNAIVSKLTSSQAQTANRALANYLNELEHQALERAEIIAGSEFIVNIIKRQDNDALARALADLGVGIDFASVCDPSGLVLARTHNNNTGDDISGYGAVRATLLSGKTHSSVANIANVGLSLYASAAIYDGDVLLGVVNCNFDLTKSEHLDAFKAGNGSEATIIYGDTRVSSTIIDKSGNRITGSKADAQIVEIVVGNQTDYTGRLEITDMMYQVYYSPLLVDGEINGMLFTGVNIASALTDQRNMSYIIILIAIIAIAAACAVSVASNRFTRIHGDVLEELFDMTASVDILESLLNAMDIFIYVADLETEKMLFVNDKFKTHFELDDSFYGESCWRVFPEGRCASCPREQLISNPGEPVSWEEHNAVSGKFYRITARIIDWPDGKKVVFHYRFDISEEKQAQEMQIRMFSIVENSPSFISYKKANRECLYVNPAAAALTGYSREELIKDYVSLLFDKETAAYIRSEIPKTAMEKGIIEYEVSAKRKDGETRFFSASTFLIESEEQAFGTVASDITEKKLIEHKMLEALEQTENMAGLLRTVNNTAALLLQSDVHEFVDTLFLCMGMIAEYVDVDRVYIWKNHLIDGELYCTQIYEWSEGAEPQQGGKYTVDIPYSENGPEWSEMLPKGQCVNGLVCEMSPCVRDHLSAQGILSILVAPVFLQDRFWGFVGFDDCHHERVFSEDEEAILRSASLLFTNALLRNEMTLETETQDKMLRAINKTARLLLETEQEDFMETLQQSLAILTEATGAGYVSIWRNNENNLAVRQAGVAADKQFEVNVDGIGFDYPTYLPEWEDEPRDDINLLAEDLNTNLRNTEMMKRCKSLLILPLNVQDEFWGFMAYEHQSEEHIYTEAEKNILRSGGNIIALAIIRHEISRGLHTAVKEAQSASLAKSEFLSRMSHEMRTPMNAIIGMTNLARKADNSPGTQEHLEKINSSAEHLLGIINDILDMSKIEAGKMELSEADFKLRDLLDQVSAVMDVKINGKRQNYTVFMDDNVPGSIVTDKQRLAQVITNLLSNANKFTPEGGNISLSIRMMENDRDRSRLLFEVKDDGVGIPEEVQERLFDAFEQADNTITRGHGGTGLGLAISQNLVNMMNGEIWVDSKPDRGSKFSFTITTGIGAADRNTIHGESEAEEADTKNVFAGKHILLADDIEINREILIALLDDTGVTVDCAENGKEAWEMFSANPEIYDLIFMDIHMPEMNGHKSAEKIREMLVPQAQTVPIIAMTADVFSQDIEKCIASGMNDHVGKPLNMDTVIAKMKQYLL